jgi:hypothetical protein
MPSPTVPPYRGGTIGMVTPIRSGRQEGVCQERGTGSVSSGLEGVDMLETLPNIRLVYLNSPSLLDSRPMVRLHSQVTD